MCIIDDQCEVADVIWRRNAISYKHVLLWHLFFNLHLAKQQSNYMGLNRKNNQITPAYLIIDLSSVPQTLIWKEPREHNWMLIQD